MGSGVGGSDKDNTNREARDGCSAGDRSNCSGNHLYFFRSWKARGYFRNRRVYRAETGCRFPNCWRSAPASESSTGGIGDRGRMADAACRRRPDPVHRGCRVLLSRLLEFAGGRRARESNDPRHEESVDDRRAHRAGGRRRGAMVRSTVASAETRGATRIVRFYFPRVALQPVDVWLMPSMALPFTRPM